MCSSLWVLKLLNSILTRSPAEQALATLQGLPIQLPAPVFELELSPFRFSPPAPQSVLPHPQFIKCEPGHPLLGMDAQGLFSLFRVAGPLVAVQMEVEVGHPNPVPVLQYWDAAHAHAAVSLLAFICAEQSESPPALLQSYNPRNLHISVRCNPSCILHTL